MGTLIIKKKMNLKESIVKAFITKLIDLEKKAFHSFCTVREAFSPIH